MVKRKLVTLSTHLHVCWNFEGKFHRTSNMERKTRAGQKSSMNSVTGLRRRNKILCLSNNRSCLKKAMASSFSSSASSPSVEVL